MELKLSESGFKTSIPLIINETVKDEETGKGKYKEIARLALPVPILADFGIDAAPAIGEDGKPELDDDGCPVYAHDVMDWLQSAIIQQVKAQSRNKVVDGKLKEGQSFAGTFAELVAVSERSGEALKARHAARASLAAYLKSQNRKDVVVKLISGLFTDTDSITTAKDEFVDALNAHLQKWVPTLSEDDKLRFSRTIERAVEAINGRKVALEDL